MRRIKQYWRFWLALLSCFGILATLAPLSLQAEQAPKTAPQPAASQPSGQAQDTGKRSEAASPPVAGGQTLVLSMKDFKDPEGYTLKTVKTERRYDFTRPTGWKVLPNSSIKVTFQHSPALLPQRSSLNVLVNNRILETIPLSKENITPTTITIPVPPNILKDRNTLTFQVDQHYTYDCEDPFSTELWTTILPDTTLALNYVPQPLQPNLARFPYPVFDELGYGTTRVGYVLPAISLSDESLGALGAVAAGLGQRIGWRPLKPFVADTAALEGTDPLIIVGTPHENAAIAALGNALPVPLSGGRFLDPKTHTALPETDGVLQFIANPNHPTAPILIVSGNSPAGVNAAARLLVQNPSNGLLIGSSAIITEFHPGPRHPYRAWEGFIQRSGNSFAQLGLDTLTARGITALPLYYNLKLMPDLNLPWQTKTKIRTVYSYSSQLDPTQSKLEVRLNGKAVKSVPLDDKNGKNLAEMTVDIPSEEVHTFNDLEYHFRLYPEKYDVCRFVTDVHLWGTVHNNTTVEVPGEVKTALPDVGLINDAGFPFTAYQDLSDVGFVLPAQPTALDVETMLQIISRFGRISASKAGINLTVNHADSLPEAIKKNSHLIAIGTEERNALMKDLQGKLHLLVTGDTAVLKTEKDKKMAELHYTPDQGVMEELISPWNDKRVALMAYGKTDTALKRLGSLFEDDALFAKIQPGNILAMDDQGPRSLTVLEKGKARFLLRSELADEGGLPSWAWVVLSFFAVMGVISMLRFIFGR